MTALCKFIALHYKVYYSNYTMCERKEIRRQEGRKDAREERVPAPPV